VTLTIGFVVVAATTAFLDASCDYASALSQNLQLLLNKEKTQEKEMFICVTCVQLIICCQQFTDVKLLLLTVPVR
jgi:hypothetical protein